MQKYYKSQKFILSTPICLCDTILNTALCIYKVCMHSLVVRHSGIGAVLSRKDEVQDGTNVGGKKIERCKE